MTLDQARAHIGARVTCSPCADDGPRPGTIERVTSRWIWVRYDQDGPHAKATHPERLTLAVTP